MGENQNTKAEIVLDEIKAPILQNIKYPVSKVDLELLLEEFKNIPDIDPESDLAPKQYQFVLKGHKAFVKARTSIEKVRKELKAPALDYGKEVDDLAKEFQAKINPTEDLLKIARDKVENYEKQKIREAEEREEKRISAIRTLIAEMKNVPLQHFSSSSLLIKEAIECLVIPSEETHEEFLEEALNTYSTTMMQLENAYDTRVKAEQADVIQAELKAKAEQEEAQRQANFAAQQADLKAQQDAFAKQQAEANRAQAERQEAFDRQIAEREAEELAKRQETERIERQKQEAIGKEARDKALQVNFQAKYDETISEMSKFKDPADLLNWIIKGNLPHVKWDPDAN